MKRALALAAATGATAALVAFATPAAGQARGVFVGPRAEVTVGYDTSRIDDQPAATPNSVDQARLGLAVGYDIALGSRWTVGAEAGVGGTLGNGRDYRVGATRFRIDQGRDIDTSLRLGYMAGAGTLLYSKAGWANSRFEVRGAAVREHSDEDGLRIGGGVEQMLGTRAYAKAEYRYTSYGDGVDRHQVLAGAGIRF